jgi:hypothetical protein
MLLVLPSLCFAFLSFSQFKPIPIANIKSLQHKSLFCFDSIGKKTMLCSLDLDGFEVEFYKASFNSKTSEVRLIGRLTPYHAYVGVYLSNNDSISLRMPISRTSYDKENLSNDGFFDISFKIEPNTILYFYELRYFARQFNISKLLKQK